MKPAALISRLYETHLNVSDLERSMRFYGGVLGLTLALREEARKLAFYWIGAPGRAFVGLWETPVAEVGRQHFAFEVAIEDLPTAIEALRNEGVTLKNFANLTTETPSVFGWMPAASIYFDDPDGHLLELIAPLPGPPRPDLGIPALNEWYRLTGTSGVR